MELNKFKPRPKPIRYLAGYLAMFLGVTAARVKVKGRRNIPVKGPCLVAMNHFSMVDPALILYAIQKPVNFLMASDQDVELIYIWAAWLYGFIPTNRIKLAPSTIKTARRLLNRNAFVGIFPEGNTHSNVLRPPKKGALYIAHSTGAPILPVAIEGAELTWDAWKKGQRPSIVVRIGKPFLLPDFTGRNHERNEFLRRNGDDLMLRIAGLLSDKYHGHYAGWPEITQYRSENRFADPSAAARSNTIPKA